METLDFKDGHTNPMPHLQHIVKLVEEKQGNLLITADHGNSEQMIDYSTGEAHTAHTTNVVPLIQLSIKGFSIFIKAIENMTPSG